MKIGWIFYLKLLEKLSTLFLTLLSKKLNLVLRNTNLKLILLLVILHFFINKDLKFRIEYVTRYCGRVPISENRIINYDGENVTFYYNYHKDESYHEVTMKATEFIMLLLRHLLPKQYKIIRYYGFYNKKHTFHDKMIMLIHETKRKIRREFLTHDT